MDFKRILKAITLAFFIFGVYYLIKGGVLIKMPTIEINNNNEKILNCDELKKFKSLNEVPESLKKDFEKCFGNDLRKKDDLVKVIKLKDENLTSTTSSLNCLELENLPYSEAEILNSSTLKEKYGNCLNLNNQNLNNLNQEGQQNQDYDLNFICSLFEPIKNINECELIVDEFGRNSCRICKSRGY